MTEHQIMLNFWGVQTLVRAVKCDIDDLRFYYLRHLSRETDDPAITVRLACVDWPERGFFRSLLAKDKLLKQFEVTPNSDRTLSGTITERFRAWSGAPSPLPPFSYTRLTDTFLVAPGSVFRMPGAECVWLRGDNYVGKTATTIELCRRGAELLSDHLLVWDPMRRLAQPYFSPLGLRRQNLIAYVSKLNGLPTRETISKDTGLVVLVRPEDLMACHSEAQPVTRVVRLIRSAVFVPRVSTHVIGAIDFFGHHEGRTGLPASESTVELPLGFSSTQAADVVLEMLN